MKNSEKILKDLIKIYSELYEHRQILSCYRLFKYDVKTVEKIPECPATNLISENTNSKTTQKSKKSKSAFSGITTRDEFKSFYYDNLVYDRNDVKKRDAIIKKYTKVDFQEMFRILFGYVSNETKDSIFTQIQYFYDSLERSTRI